MLARVIPVLAIALAAAGCSGGSSASSGPPPSSGPPVATTLPASGTVRLSDGITYTVAAPGSTLRLDNLTLRIDDVTWTEHVTVPVSPPGTRIFAVITVTVANRTADPQVISATQIWLRNTDNHTFLAAAGASARKPLVGRRVQPGQRLRGTLVYPLPGRMRGGLLVYRFGDEPASATHVGIARYD